MKNVSSIGKSGLVLLRRFVFKKVNKKNTIEVDQCKEEYSLLRSEETTWNIVKNNACLHQTGGASLLGTTFNR